MKRQVPTVTSALEESRNLVSDDAEKNNLKSPQEYREVFDKICNMNSFPDYIREAYYDGIEFGFEELFQ